MYQPNNAFAIEVVGKPDHCDDEDVPRMCLWGIVIHQPEKQAVVDAMNHVADMVRKQDHCAYDWHYTIRLVGVGGTVANMNVGWRLGDESSTFGTYFIQHCFGEYVCGGVNALADDVYSHLLGVCKAFMLPCFQTTDQKGTTDA